MSSPGDQRLLTYVDALREGLAQEMQRDPRVLVFGLDVDDHKAIQGSTRGLVEQFGAERVFGTPLSEDAMTGVAIGAAMAGMRPVHVHIRMDFLMLCMNQLVNIAAKSRYMYDGQVKVPLVVRSMIGKSWGQGAQHSQGLHSMFMHVPGLKVVAPSNAFDAKGCLIYAIRDDDPVIFVEHRLLYFSEAYVPSESFEVPFGKARLCTRGDDITIVGISNMLLEVLRAHGLLADVGIHAEVIDPIWLMPLDIDTIIESAQRTGRLLVVDNAWTNCGASAEIVARIAEHPHNGKPIRVKRMGYAPTTCPTTPVLEREFYPDPVKIAQTAHAMVRPDVSDWNPVAKDADLASKVKFRGPF
jgi:acetoin:2,6-dichlorophenolindophenol oxidoreductase subunit beta